MITSKHSFGQGRVSTNAVSDSKTHWLQNCHKNMTKILLENIKDVLHLVVLKRKSL